MFCFSISPILAQDKVKIELKEGMEPDVYIDGKKYDYSIFDLLDQRKIESMNVIKDDKAKKLYNAPNGVIIIKTKGAVEQTVAIDKDQIKFESGELSPIIIIDGNVADKETLSVMSPDDIESIKVVKGEKAIEQYNTLTGVIIVTTKNN